MLHRLAACMAPFLPTAGMYIVGPHQCSTVDYQVAIASHHCCMLSLVRAKQTHSQSCFSCLQVACTRSKFSWPRSFRTLSGSERPSDCPRECGLCPRSKKPHLTLEYAVMGPSLSGRCMEPPLLEVPPLVECPVAELTHSEEVEVPRDSRGLDPAVEARDRARAQYRENHQQRRRSMAHDRPRRLQCTRAELEADLGPWVQAVRDAHTGRSERDSQQLEPSELHTVAFRALSLTVVGSIALKTAAR